jgi:hypothetical protein
LANCNNRSLLVSADAQTPVRKHKVYMYILRKFFEKKPGLLYFGMGDKLIATTPLVMTRTLTDVAEYIPSFQATRYNKFYVLTRPEDKRFLSGYNKKVLASSLDISKRLLLCATGLSYNQGVSQVISILSERRNNNQFIDRHFVPQNVYLSQLSNSVDWTTLSIEDDLTSHLGSLPRNKSSDSLTYRGRPQKINLNATEARLLRGYFALWR